MIFWIDAQLSPALAPWISTTFGVEARALRDLGLRDAQDLKIFWAARAAGATVVTKDRDYLDLLNRFGPPPPILWITCGNTSNTRLRMLLRQALPVAMQLLADGNALVEIGDAR